MAASLQVTERGMEFRGKGTLIIYDVPAKVIGERGRHPARFRYLIKKFIDSGRVSRLQGSVLLVEDPSLIEPLIDLIVRFGGSVLLVQGHYADIIPRER